MTVQSFMEIFGSFVAKLDSKNISYMIVGSIASTFYGEPRLTNDLDLVVELAPNDLKTLTSLFETSGHYFPPHAIISDAILNKGQFNIIHTSSGLKIDVIVKKVTPHAIMEFSRRRRVKLSPTIEAWIASAEDVIIKKLAYFREGGSQKHISDIRAILANNSVDESYLQKWIAETHLESEWNTVNSF